MSRQNAQAPRTNRNRTYIEGNTVRKLDNAVERRQREQRQREKGKRIDHAARANRQRAAQLNPGYLAFLTFAVAITVGICVAYIQVQSEASSRMKKISTLQGEILDIKSDNDAAMKRIDTSVDMEAIKSTAINEMGMVYPTQEQIVYFEVNKDDYMNQYQDIPEK